MATIKKSYAAETMLKRTALYGGVTNPLQTQVYIPTGDVDLETNGYHGAHVVVKFKGNNNKDKFVIGVFASLDGTNYDTEPFMLDEIENKGKPQQISFIVADVAHFRIGVKCSDTNTTFEYEILYQAWNESST